MARQIKPGDVFEFKTAKGFVQFQVTHYYDSYGDLVRILEGFTSDPGPVTTERLNAVGPFYIFLYFTPEWRKKQVVKLGNFPIPAHAQAFPPFRLPAMINTKGPVTRWRLWAGLEEYFKGELTPEQLKIPPLRITGIYALTYYLDNGWLPEKDLMDPRGWQQSS